MTIVKIKRIRTKFCQKCELSQDALFRVRHQKEGQWEFLCRVCMEQVRKDNLHYQYGGTWKSRKRH